jgi:hypothetical protein
MGGASNERARVRRHLEGALRAVRRRRAALPPAIAARRETLVKHLRAYIDAGRFPVNRCSDEPTPIFVDERGSRCAVAALMEATGEGGLVEAVARTRNRARVRELVADPGFADWLALHGLSAWEAARIQPAYAAYLEPDWRPTVSVIAGAQATVTRSIGLESTVLAGVRAGIRRNVQGSDNSGNSQYGSAALTFEYARVVVESGATHHFALVLQFEPIANQRDVQWYVLGGPLASVDSNDQPGSGLGVELGTGVSFRRRDIPLFAEIVVQGLSRNDRPTAGLGLQLGVVW